MAKPATTSGQTLNALSTPPAHERGLTVALHLASIVAPLWLPFVVWFAAHQLKTPFLKAHARQAAFEGIMWKAIMVVLGIVSLIFTVTRLFHHFSTDFQDFTWAEVGIKILITLVVFALLWLFNLVQSLFQARAAYKGIWPRRERKKFAAGGAG